MACETSAHAVEAVPAWAIGPAEDFLGTMRSRVVSEEPYIGRQRGVIVPLSYDEIVKLGNGSRFVRADLHIHSAFSHDISDQSITPEAIVDTAEAAGLEVISITDHNAIGAVLRAVEYAGSKYSNRLLVIPGIEITTPQGHLLVYFDESNFSSLEKLFHALDIVSDSQGSRTPKSIVDVVGMAFDLGGISIAAHIDTAKGFEVGHPGFEAWKTDLMCHPGLFGLEFRDPANRFWYSTDDPEPGNVAESRRNIARRRAATAARAFGDLARFTNSDAHTLAQIASCSSVTRIKMSSLSFESFRCALADPASRIKVDASLPNAVPQIRGLEIEGGFLDGTAIHFSSNLNVLFGGRGTGKSTAVKALAYALGHASNSSELFDGVTLFCEDAAGVQYRFDRSQTREAKAIRKPDGSVTHLTGDPFKIEYFGQGELSRVAQSHLANTAALQEFFDQHIAFDNLKDEEIRICGEAEELGRQLAPFVVAAASRKQLSNDLASLEAQLKASEASQIKSVAEFQNRLTAERTLRDSYREIIGLYKRGLSHQGLVREPKQLRELSHVEKFLNDTDEPFGKAESIVDDTNKLLVESAAGLNAELQRRADAIEIELQRTEPPHKDLDERIAAYIIDLKKKGLATSIAEFVDWSKRKTGLVAQIGRIDNQKSQLDELQSRYQAVIAELEAVRAEITERRKTQIAALNDEFARTITQYKVQVVGDPSGMTQDYIAFIGQFMDGSYMGAELKASLAAQTSPSELATMLEAADKTRLASLTGVGDKWAEDLIKRMGIPSVTLQLRTIWKPYLPIIRVWDSARAFAEIKFSNLSDGQKNTILLTVALLSTAASPLVIDQPEDDLDNHFIADTVVKTLKRVKERRQVILVTHNANIAVLGDSEQLLAMERTGGGGGVASSGSIDDAQTKLAVQECLEGGAAALKRRVEMYG